MKVILDKIPNDAGRKHQVNEGRDQREQNLKDENVGKCDESQSAFACEDAAMLKNGLQNSERPAEALPHERVGICRSLSESERHIFIFHAVAVAQQRHGEIGVFGNGVDMKATRL